MFLRPQGYGVITEPDKAVVEHDTFSCCHCNRIVIVMPRASAEDCGGLCKVCMKLICAECAGKGVCTPWLAQLDQMEARQAALRSYGF